MLIDFAVVLVFLVFIILFIFITLLVGRLIRPHRPNNAKNSTFECGEPPIGSAWLNYNLRFYFIALVFIIFDVEIAFIIPVATVFRDWVRNGIGTLALVELLIFIGILFMGLVYVWAKGDLSWIREFVRGGKSPIETFEKKLMPDGQK